MTIEIQNVFEKSGDLSRDKIDVSITSVSNGDFQSGIRPQKRERMRERFMNATMQVCADKKRLPYTIEEVAQAAGASRGMFYEHFSTLEELIQAVGTKMGDTFTQEALRLFPEIPRGILSTASGVRLLLSRAVCDHTWGRFVVHSDFLPPSSVIGKITREDLATGHASGHFVFSLYDVAFDIIIGSVVEGIRRMVNGVSDAESYIYQLTIHILQSLGVSHITARSAAEDIYAFHRLYAPQRLSWWNFPTAAEPDGSPQAYSTHSLRNASVPLMSISNPPP